MTGQPEPAMVQGGTGRDRLLAAALGLFAEHGVSGTSLQMIADALGVTKAAIYYHFKTKGEIVLALIGPVLEELAALADEAERKRFRGAQIDTLLTGLVDLVIRNRSLYAVLQGDLAVAQIIEQHRAHPTIGTRIIALLVGPDSEPGAFVAANMLLGGLRDAGFAPGVRDYSDADLRGYMLESARRLIRYRRPSTRDTRLRPVAEFTRARRP
ncbi:TetR/AcrR family transcriptional regulator [Parafrankia sp. FMc2]|uniref:TetR/AcrR family transcriptional regulator n=1 Tax=Parafrankia sp. FMc2 TaxID=3233196 RepID=UPI0034D4279D